MLNKYRNSKKYTKDDVFLNLESLWEQEYTIPLNRMGNLSKLGKHQNGGIVWNERSLLFFNSWLINNLKNRRVSGDWGAKQGEKCTERLSSKWKISPEMHQEIDKWLYYFSGFSTEIVHKVKESVNGYTCVNDCTCVNGYTCANGCTQVDSHSDVVNLLCSSHNGFRTCLCVTRRQVIY